jgi:hypothetical protein
MIHLRPFGDGIVGICLIGIIGIALMAFVAASPLIKVLVATVLIALQVVVIRRFAPKTPRRKLH